MATYAAGVTVSWNSVNFREVVDLKFAHGGGLPISRGGTGTPFSVDLGSIDVVCLHTANCSFANYGKRATFSVSGGAATFMHAAIYERLAVENKVNDVQRFTVTLRFSPQ
jgi:hypothetical protein